MGVAFVLALAAALPDALLAVWFTLLGEGLLEHKPGLLRFAVVALAVSTVATWLLQTVSTRLQRRFRDKVTIALESHVARLQASISTIAHQERPEYLDRLSVLREQIFTLDHMYMSVFSTAGWLLRLAVTVALLATVNPVLDHCWSSSPSRRWRPPSWRPVSRARRPGTRRAGRPPGQTPVHADDHRLAGQGAARARHRPGGWPTAAGRPGSSGTARWQRRGRDHRSGTRPAGRSSRSATWARS